MVKDISVCASVIDLEVIMARQLIFIKVLVCLYTLCAQHPAR